MSTVHEILGNIAALSVFCPGSHVEHRKDIEHAEHVIVIRVPFTAKEKSSESHG